jgi:hypothetical protein
MAIKPMKEETIIAMKALTESITSNTTPDAALKLSQAVLNLAHAEATLGGLRNLEKTQNDADNTDDIPTFECQHVGSQFIFWCKHCGNDHVHGEGEGHRSSHCPAYRPRGYFLKKAARQLG